MRGYKYDGERYYKVNRPDVNNGHSFNPEEDYHFIKDWLYKRIKWLDTAFAKKDPNIDASGNTRSQKIFFYTTHSGVAKVDAYLNGSTKLGMKNLSANVAALYNIETSMLDMSDGALNVIYFIAYRQDNSIRSISSVYIRVSDTPNPEADECVVEFGDEKMIVKKGSEITIPEKAYSRSGYAFCGWASSITSERLYKPGDTIVVTKDLTFYMRFKPADMCSQFVLDSYKEKQ